jgi:N-acetyl-gamma-glutamyl-phosphate reductase
VTVSVFIDGAAGTTGLEIRERLAGRSDLEIVVLDAARRKDESARREALNDSDFAILCLPDDAARESVRLAEGGRTRLIDASTAHRVADGWTYGFPELTPDHAARIAEARRVSNPGCYPTGLPRRWCGRWSTPGWCRPTGRSASTPCRAIRAAARP